MPKFTKKHYEEVAKYIKMAKKHSSQDIPGYWPGINFLQIYLEDMFLQDNPLFKRDLFQEAASDV